MGQAFTRNVQPPPSTEESSSGALAQLQPQPWCHTQEGLVLLQRIHDNDQSLSAVYLVQRGLGDEDAGELATALQTNSNVKGLLLHGNEIGDDGVTALAGVLQDNSTLELLGLGNNRVRDGGGEALALMVRNSSAIKRLYLGGNQIEDGGARALAMALVHNSTLEELRLNKNSISDGGSEAFASAICLNPSLSYLSLNRNRIGEKGTRSLSTSTRNLRGEDVGQENVAAFAKGLFAETAPIQLGLEELGAIKQHLVAGNTGEGVIELFSGLVGVPRRVNRAGQQNLMRAVIRYGMVQAAVSEKEDCAILMIVEKAGMADGIRSVFEIARAKPGLFKSA